MSKTASAIWKGDLKTGTGTLSTESGSLRNATYDFCRRFEDTPGLNPEELIAAAHASCFAMATSAQLGERGITPESVETSAAVSMKDLTLTKSELTANVSAPGADEAKVREAVEAAKTGCPISKALNLEITLDLTVNV